MMLWRLAWRNVFRNPRRSALTIAAMAVGLAALFFLWSFIEGVNDQMIENSTRYVAGHVQLHRSGYHDNQTLDLVMDDPGPVLAALAGEAGIVATAQRLEAMAVASLGDKSRGVMLMGVDPGQEQALTTLHRTIVQGSYLSSADAREIVIGDKAAEILGARLGDEVVLLTQAADGAVGAGRYRVRGIFDAHMDMLDGALVLMPLAAAQDLLAAGHGVSAVVVRLQDRRQAAALAARAAARLGPGYEGLAWEALLPTVVQSTRFHDVLAIILLLVLFVVVAVGVTNTVLMGVMERLREFGVMMALGTSGAQLTRLVFAEACILGVLGLACGAGAGRGLTGYWGQAGIDLSHYDKAMESMQGLTGVVYPMARADRLLLLSAIVFCTSLVAAVYPAWRAVRLDPVQAIKGGAHDSGSRAGGGGGPLPLFLKIAARSVGRNRRRAILTASASAFGLGAFVFLLSFVQGYLSQLVTNSTGYITGDLQVQHARFRDDMAPEFSLAQDAVALAAARRHPAVVAAAPRVQAQVLVSSAVKSAIVNLVGIDPAQERRVTAIDRALRQGRWLEPARPRDVAIGRALAAELGVREGEKLIVMAQARDGTVASAAYRVGAIFATESPAFDHGYGFVNLASAQALLGLEGRLSALALRLRERDDVAAVAAALRERQDPALAVLPWQELLPEVSQMIGYVRLNLRLVVGIVFAVVAIGVMNTLLMSVLERTREFGIMLALGTAPGGVVRIVVYEALVLSLCGLLIGFLGGVAVVAYFNSAGIDMSRYAEGITTIPGLTGMIYPELALRSTILPAGALLALSVLATLYPAWKAARLQPIEAIRHG